MQLGPDEQGSDDSITTASERIIMVIYQRFFHTCSYATSGLWVRCVCAACMLRYRKKIEQRSCFPCTQACKAYESAYTCSIDVISCNCKRTLTQCSFYLNHIHIILFYAISTSKIYFAIQSLLTLRKALPAVKSKRTMKTKQCKSSRTCPSAMNCNTKDTFYWSLNGKRLGFGLQFIKIFV